LGKTGAFDDKFLLLSKWLWRLGYVRTPESCSADTVYIKKMTTKSRLLKKKKIGWFIRF